VNNQARLVIAVLFIFIGITIGEISNYAHSFKKVYVKLDQKVQVDVYKDTLGTASSSKSTPKSVAQLSTSGWLKLKKGTYDFIVNDPSHQYEAPITKTTVTDFSNSITIDPSFSSQKLGTLLVEERPAIQAALLAFYPTLNSSYRVSSDELFGSGNWYGASLSPISPGVDKVVLIMEQKNGVWSMAARPQISISIPSNSTIPSSIIDSVDQF
jgi:hypothetical protein